MFRHESSKRKSLKSLISTANQVNWTLLQEMAFEFCCRVNGVTFMREFDSIFFIEMSHSICACVARESRYMPRYDTVTLRLNSKRKHYGNGNQIIFHTQYALCTEYTQAVKIYADKKFGC